ncbi:HET-domain-containing protein, partial [Lizonia empirigonia]
MATNAYPGEPLGSDQIRLIRLRPGKWTDPIVCKLYNTQQINAQGDCVHYCALSYVWGSRGVTRPILLAGQTYHITVNLERALRYSRHHYLDGMILWVDALCIDQTDMKERTHQVQLMGQIYSKCSKMIIYLG